MLRRIPDSLLNPGVYDFGIRSARSITNDNNEHSIALPCVVCCRGARLIMARSFAVARKKKATKADDKVVVKKKNKKAGVVLKTSQVAAAATLVRPPRLRRAAAAKATTSYNEEDDTDDTAASSDEEHALKKKKLTTKQSPKHATAAAARTRHRLGAYTVEPPPTAETVQSRVQPDDTVQDDWRVSSVVDY